MKRIERPSLAAGMSLAHTARLQASRLQQFFGEGQFGNEARGADAPDVRQPSASPQRGSGIFPYGRLNRFFRASAALRVIKQIHFHTPHYSMRSPSDHATLIYIHL